MTEECKGPATSLASLSDNSLHPHRFIPQLYILGTHRFSEFSWLDFPGWIFLDGVPFYSVRGVTGFGKYPWPMVIVTVFRNHSSNDTLNEHKIIS